MVLIVIYCDHPSWSVTAAASSNYMRQNNVFYFLVICNIKILDEPIIFKLKSYNTKLPVWCFGRSSQVYTQSWHSAYGYTNTEIFRKQIYLYTHPNTNLLKEIINIIFYIRSSQVYTQSWHSAFRYTNREIFRKQIYLYRLSRTQIY